LIPFSIIEINERDILLFATIHSFLKEIAKKDPEVEFVADYGEQQFGYNKLGYLFRFKTRFSDWTKIAENKKGHGQIPVLIPIG
jgi:hypothetical protein